MKDYIDKIVANGKKEDMDCLSDILVDLMYELKETNHKEFTMYKNKIIGMAYDYKINEELGHDIVQDMRPLGEYWSRDTVKSVVGDVPNLDEIYVVINSLANDYKDVISLEDTETYVKMANAWINDVDARKDKAWNYFINK